MSDLLGLLRETLGTEQVSAISQKIGADEDTTRKAIGVALPALISGLGRTAASPQAASVFTKILDQDNDGSILDDIVGILGGSKPEPKPQPGLLPEIFGGRQERVEKSVSKTSGLDMASVQKLIAILGPILMGVLLKKKKADNLDNDGLSGLLRKEQTVVEETHQRSS